MFRSVQPASKWAKASSQLRPTFSASVATLQLGIDAASLRAASCPHTTWLPGWHSVTSSCTCCSSRLSGGLFRPARCGAPESGCSIPYSVSDVFCFGERSPIAFAGPARYSFAVLRAPCGSRPVPCLVKTISAHHRAQSHAVTNCPLAIKRARTIPSPRAPWQAYHGACNI